MKTFKKNKYDFIIYGCLIGAVICLLIGTKDYFKTLKEESSMKHEVTSAIKEIKGIEDNGDFSVVDSESDNIKDYDKK